MASLREKKERKFCYSFFAKVQIITRALRHRNFRLFIAGQFLSVIGTWVQVVAQSWLVYRLSHSSVMLGLVAFAAQIPYLLLAPVAGVIADRMSRHRLVILTQTLAILQACVLAGLTLAGVIKVWHIFSLALVLGFVSAVDTPARGSFIAEMVGKEDLMNAIGLNSTVMNSGRLIGPAVAGVLVTILGEGYCFLINAFSFLAVIAGLLMMRLPRSPLRKTPVPHRRHFQEGWSYVRNHVPTRTLLLLMGLVSIMSHPYQVLMPVFADQILQGGPKALGILMSATGVGAVLGSIYTASQTSIRGLGRTIPVATAAFSTALIIFAFSRSLYFAVPFLLLAGYGMMVQTTSIHTALQTIVPDALRGRMMGFYTMMFLGMPPFGSLMAGWLGDLIGAPFTVAFGAVVCIAGTMAFNRQYPVIQSTLEQSVAVKAES